jgi:hypothetical protein
VTRDLADNNTRTASSTRLRIGRILAGGFLLEVVLFVVLIPPAVVIGMERVVPFVYPALLVFGFLVTWWILRKVPNRPVAHGTLIGIVATAIYILPNFFNPDGIGSVIAIYGLLGFILANALRVAGCIAGGYALQMQRERK